MYSALRTFARSVRTGSSSSARPSLFARGGAVLALAGLALGGLLPSLAAGQDAIDIENGVLTVAMANEPPQLNSTKATDQVSFMVLGHVMEGLLRYDAAGQLAPGVATHYELEGKKAVFYLRRNSLWSDGRPVTAHDFVFAWRTVVSPETASEYAFILYPIKNAEAVNAGKLPLSALGVRAVDDYTLEVRLARPIAYFDKLVAFSVYYPVREDFYKSRDGRYGADAEDLLYNGAFRITEWVHSASLTVDKNEYYWDRDSIRLNRIDWAYVTPDTSAKLNFFKDGQIAMVELGAETMQLALDERWRLKKFNDGSLFFLEFNHRSGRLTDNLNFRRAIQAVFDPYEFANRVVAVPGTLPGLSMMPVWLQGHRLRLRQEYPAPPLALDREKALEYLELAREELLEEDLNEELKEELRNGKFPPLSLLVGDAPTSRKQAEYLQELLKDALGLDLRIDAQTFKQRLEKMTSGAFDLVGAGWGPDYDDPLTFADLFSSWNLNNRGRYANAEMDALVKRAESSLDSLKRSAIFDQIQKHLHNDVVLIPQYERSKIYVQRPELRGMARRVIGPDPDYSRAWLVPLEDPKTGQQAAR